MFNSKGFKILSSAAISILMIAQTAMASPSLITYQDSASSKVKADYLQSLSSPVMKSALSTAISANVLANRPIYVTDSNGKVIDYSAAINKSENYAAALLDVTVNNATAPIADKQLNSDGTVTLVQAMISPSLITYLDATGLNVQVDYLKALSNPAMKSALIAALSANALANRAIFVTNNNGKVLDYLGAINKNLTYTAALLDSSLNNAIAPIADEEMNVDGTVSEVFANVFDSASTFGPATGVNDLSGNANITAAGATLQNVIIEGNLDIAASVGEGDVNLNNVTVKGRTIVKGGGVNSIHITNCNLTGDLVIIKEGGNVRIVAAGSTYIPTSQIESGAILETQNLTGTGSGFGLVTVAQVLSGQTLDLEGDFDSVTIDAPGVTITMPSGQVGTLTLGQNSTGSSFNVSGGTVAALNVSSDSSVEMSGGTITALTLGQNSTGSSVNVSGGTVTALNVSTQSSVQVSGGAVTGLTISQGATNASVTVNSGTVGQLNVDATAQVQVQGGTVTGVTVASTAANTTMNVGAGATVTNLTLNAGTTVTGTGSIGTAVINASGSSIQETPTSTTVASTVTGGTSVGGTTVEPGTTSGPGSTNGNGSTTTALAVTSVTPLLSTGTILPTVGSTSFNLDLSSITPTVRLTGLQVNSNGSNPSLNISSIKVRGVEWLTGPLTAVSQNGQVLTSTLLGVLDTGNNGVSMTNLRLVFGQGPVILTGHLEENGYSPSPTITVTITLGTPTPAVNSISNTWMTITKTSSTTATVGIKSGTADTTTIGYLTSSNFDFVNVVYSMLGSIDYSSNGGTPLQVSILGSVSGYAFNDIPLSKLVNKTVSFGTSPNIYTLNFVSIP